jgi:class 3 adenylate cyclase
MARRRSPTILAAVLFTDIVGSSAIAAEMGDRRWKELISRHHAIVRRELRRFGGRELDTAGDGFFASFERPGDAIRCACAATEAVRGLGIELRAGVHFGECETTGGKLGGIGVHTAARIMGQAGAGEVWISGTTRDLVAGSGFGLAERGRHELKGIPGEWLLFMLTAVDGQAREGPPDAGEARRRRDEVQPPVASRRRFVALGAVGVVIVAAVIALLLAGVFSSSRAAASISENSIAGASLGQLRSGYEHLFGSEPGSGIETQTHFPYLTWDNREIAVYFGQLGGGGVVIDTWNKAYRTAAGVGPCSSFAQVKKAYGSRLKPSRWNKAQGKYYAYTLGPHLIFASNARPPTSPTVVSSVALYYGPPQKKPGGSDAYTGYLAISGSGGSSCG